MLLVLDVTCHVAGDVYSFGILMWEAYTGQIAFQGLHYGEVFEQVALLQRRPDIPPEMPPDYAGTSPTPAHPDRCAGYS